MLTLDELQRKLTEWQHAQPWDAEDPTAPLLGVVEEVGELSHAHLKLQQGIRGTPETLYAEKRDAVADILIYLADYCTRNGINLQLALEEAWREVSQRNFTLFPKNGVSE